MRGCIKGWKPWGDGEPLWERERAWKGYGRALRLQSSSLLGADHSLWLHYVPLLLPVAPYPLPPNKPNELIGSQRELVRINVPWLFPEVGEGVGLVYIFPGKVF